MKVLHVCETATGGIATYFRLLHAFSPHNVENVFLVPESHKKDLDENMALITYPARKRGGRSLYEMCRTARNALTAQRPDIISFHSTF